MKCMIGTAARARMAQIACMALLGLVPGLRLHTADFKFAPIDYPNSLATEVLGIKDQGANFNQSSARTERHDYTRGDVPGSIGATRQTLKAGSIAPRGKYNYIRVDVPGAVSTNLYGINSRGQTVGLYVDGSGTSHGLLRNVDGSVVRIDYPGAMFTTANGINSLGDIVGRWDDARGITHSFLRRSQGLITSFDPPAPCLATTMPAAAHGINDWGDIVGRCFDASAKELGWLLRHDGSSAILDDPSFDTTDCWAIDNSRVVVGDYYIVADDFVHGFTWTKAKGFTTLDFENNITGLRAINQRGDISGIYFAGSTLHGFLRLKNGTEATIDPPGSVWTATAVVNNSGMVAGAYLDADSNEHGYIAISCRLCDSRN